MASDLVNAAHVSSWQAWHPFVLAASAAMAIAYLFLVAGPGRRFFSAATAPPPLRMIRFLIGVCVFYAAFGSPLAHLADHFLFSAYMLQNILEIIVMTPFLLTGLPDWLIRPVLLPLVHWRGYKSIAKPVIRALTFNVVFVLFHLPPVFTETLLHPWFHDVEHIVFFMLAVFLWMPIVSPLPEIQRLRAAAQVVYIFFAGNLLMPLIILLLFTQTPFYPIYLHVPRVLGLSVLADQQLGLLVMLVGMLVPFFGIGVYAYARYDNVSFYQ
ncbi:MAG: cytochrome c oxidase assembly protein [Bacilli bacterium]